MSTLSIGRLVLASTIAPLFVCLPIQAQIVPDTTLPVNSTVAPGCTSCTINGGTVRGTNWFHSFQGFSVPTGGVAWFNNGPTIQTILARVTGNSTSTIDGLLRTNGTASLFLLNPNGITFRANARLEIGGSFLASTASSFRFADGSEFSATAPQAPPLLTVNLAPGLQLGASRSGATVTQRGSLQAGGNLTLVAARLDLQGSLQAGNDLTLQAQTTVQIRDTIATPFRAQAGGNLTIQGGSGVDISATNHLTQVPFLSGGNLTLRSDGAIATAADFQAGGNFAIQTLAGDPGNFTSTSGPSITAIGDLTVGNYTGASLKGVAGGNLTYDNLVINRIVNRVYPTNPAVLLTAGGGIRGGNVSTTVRTGKLAVDFQSQGSIQINRIKTQGGSIVLTSRNGDILTSRDPNLPSGGDIDSTSTQSNGGEIRLTAQGNITAGRVYSFATAASGGAITLSAATGNLDTFDVFSYSGSGGRSGTGGDISFSAPQGSIQAWGFSSNVFSSRSLGTAGAVRLAALNDINIPGSILALVTAGKGGSVTLTSTQGNLSITGDIVSQSARGDGGDVTLATGRGNINARAGIFTSGRTGAGGDVTVLALGGNLRIGETNTYSLESRGGTIDLTATGDVTTYSLNTTAKLGSGDIRITTQGEFSPGVREQTDSKGVTRFSSVISSDTFGPGRGGDIEVTAGSINLQAGAQISASTHANGAGGNIVLRATEAIDLAGVIPQGLNPGPYARAGLSRSEEGNYFGGYVPTGVTSRFDTTSLNNGQFPTGVFTQTTIDSVGNAGSITIDTQRLSVQEGAAIAVTTFGQGSAGNIRVRATDIRLANGSIFSGAAAGSGGSGTIELAGRSLALTDQGLIQTRTLGRGLAGNVTIDVNRVTLNNSAIRSGSGDAVVRSGDLGRAGNIQVNADTLRLENNAMLDSQTFGPADGGSIGVTAKGVEVLTGGQLTSSTRSSGKAGNIVVQASDRLRLSDRNSGLFANTAVGSTGDGGSVWVIAPTTQIQNQAAIAVNSQGTGIGGNVQVQGSSLSLSDQALLSATTVTSQGGNIQITLSESLRMRRGSLISTTAGEDVGAGAGGNITIRAPFLLSYPLENNDIIANAFSAVGGQINITAPLGIYWFTLQSRSDLERLLNTSDPTQLSPRRLSTNDITAFSQANPRLPETINLDTKTQNPTELPIDFLDSGSSIVARCSSDHKLAGGYFVQVGRDGLPANPTQVLGSTPVITRLAGLTQELGPVSDSAAPVTVSSPPLASSPPLPQPPPQIVEAQGITVSVTGEISLVAPAGSR